MNMGHFVFISRRRYSGPIFATNNNKNNSVDTFETHEGVLYCKLHFKSLFSPKAVEDTEDGKCVSGVFGCVQMVALPTEM